MKHIFGGFIVAALLLLLLIAPSSEAQYRTYYPSSGYNYAGNYYTTYYPGNYYTAPYSGSYAEPDYYNGNYYYHNAGYYKGNWYPAGYYKWSNGAWYLQNYGYLYSTSKAPEYAPGWQAKLLDIAANRDKVEGSLKKAALDHQAYMEAVQALGLNGNFRWSSYGKEVAYPSPVGYHGYGTSLNLGSYGANANTIYGYSLTSVKDIYGDTSPSVLYQQAARLGENAQNAAKEANSGFQDLVNQDGERRARLAEILAKGQAAKMALDAANAQAHTTETKTESFRVESSQQQKGNVPNLGQQPAPASAAFRVLATTKCAACHSGDKKKGGFDVASYTNLPLDMKAKVWDRLFTTDKDKIMPRNPEGGPGNPLTAAEKKLFIDN